MHVTVRPHFPDMVRSPEELEVRRRYLFNYCLHLSGKTDIIGGVCQPQSCYLTVVGLPQNGKVKMKTDRGEVSDRGLQDLGLEILPDKIWHHRTYLVPAAQQ